MLTFGTGLDKIPVIHLKLREDQYAGIFNSDVCHFHGFHNVEYDVYRGNTDLIHSYHQTQVNDKSAYGKPFGKALFMVAAAPFISGFVGLFCDSDFLASTAVIVLIVGIVLEFCCILAVQ